MDNIRGLQCQPVMSDESTDPFVEVLFGEDELGCVLRAHIYIEAKLLELLDLLVKEKGSLRKLNLEFSQSVDLAVALGLPSDHASGLRAFGNLRNTFAHNLETVLSAERVRNLYEALSSRDKEYIEQSYKNSAPLGETVTPFKDRMPKTQFVFIATGLYSLVEAAVLQRKSN